MPTILITGANRGIGLEFVRQYAADGWHVIATARSDSPELEALGVRVERLDMRDFAALEAFPRRLGGAKLDLFIANAGITAGRRVDTAADAEAALEVLAVNAVAPTLLARALLPSLAGGKMAAITSRMGSIADSSGGYLGYRASKAAMNAFWYNLAAETDVPLILFHPGWVQTDMGGPNAQVAPPQSVAGMRRFLDELTPERSGAFVDYTGEPIPW
ncbi:MAG TPA: SDR family oxidoreductase [Allosphingosinicella sp.]|jgi:NAD(P)-dependent dehydrogenase (short-subunit alcohol dehydrogenase family)